MLVRFVTFFVNHARLTIIGWVIAVIFGAVAYQFLMPREGFPAIDVPISVVAGGYFVDDPDKVDADVAVPIAEAVGELDGVEMVSSYSRASSFSVIVNLSSDMTSAEGSTLIEDQIAALDLPPEAQLAVQSIEPATFLDGGYDLLIALYGDADTTGVELQEAGVAYAAALTDPDIESVALEPLFESGINPATGETVEQETSFNQVTGEDDTTFHPSVTIGVRADDGVDAIEVRDATERAMAQAKAEGALAEGMNAVVAIDFATVVDQQISELQSNVGTGLIAVAIVALLLISWRASLITAVFLVSVLAVSAGVMYLVGITLNTISLFALILALGLFVDDSIVITEAISSYRRRAPESAGPVEIIGDAIGRVGSASISGTLTTVLVFVPMLMISGILGSFIRILPITVIVSLLVSLLLSLIVIPVATRYLLLSSPRSRGLLEPVETKIAEYLASLPLIGGRKGLWIGLFAVFLSIAATTVGLTVFAPRVGFNIFPAAKDATEIQVDYTFAPDTAIAEANEIALELNDMAADELGDDLERGYLYVGSARSAVAQLTLTPIGGRPTVHEYVDRLQARGDELMTNGRVVYSAISAGPPEALFPFTMQIFGDDPSVTVAAAEEMSEDILQHEFVLPSGEAFRAIETEVALNTVVARSDGRRFIELRARFDNDSTSSVTAEVQNYFEENYDATRLEELGLDSDALGFDFGIESDNQESFNSLPLAFGLALLAMLVLLVIQFRSSVQWILVFLAIPFSFFGVFGGLLITDNPLSFFVMLGLIGLIGIAVNNTILLTDYANQERAAGERPRAAISTAVRRRFRPLVATSLTTVAGLLPLALSDPFWEGLAFTIIFGLLSSTFFVLVSFPFYYLAIEELRERIHVPWRRDRAQPAEVAATDAAA